MTHYADSGRAYRDAIALTRATHPTAAAAISAHVNFLARRVADLETDLPRLQARITELVQIQTQSDDLEQPLLIVQADGVPASTTSAPEIVEAAMALIGDLLAPDTEPAQRLTEAAVLHGPVSGPVFLIALQFLTEQVRPILHGLGYQPPTA